jgi:hypothetical protein
MQLHQNYDLMAPLCPPGSCCTFAASGGGQIPFSTLIHGVYVTAGPILDRLYQPKPVHFQRIRVVDIWPE